MPSAAVRVDHSKEPTATAIHASVARLSPLTLRRLHEQLFRLQLSLIEQMVAEGVSVPLVTAVGHTATVQIGSAPPLTCAGNTTGGNIEVVDNSNSALMFDNSVGGNMSVLDNTGPVDVEGNIVRGNLTCQNNSMLMMGSGNAASRKTG
jgi:hypothetical protein